MKHRQLLSAARQLGTSPAFRAACILAALIALAAFYAALVRQRRAPGLGTPLAEALGLRRPPAAAAMPPPPPGRFQAAAAPVVAAPLPRIENAVLEAGPETAPATTNSPTTLEVEYQWDVLWRLRASGDGTVVAVIGSEGKPVSVWELRPSADGGVEAHPFPGSPGQAAMLRLRADDDQVEAASARLKASAGPKGAVVLYFAPGATLAERIHREVSRAQAYWPGQARLRLHGRLEASRLRFRIHTLVGDTGESRPLPEPEATAFQSARR